MLNIFIANHWVRLFDSIGNIGIMYDLNLEVEDARELISITERILELEPIQVTKPRVQTILESKEEVPEYLVYEQISSVWDKATKVLKEKLVPASFETWIAPVIPALKDNRLLLLCSNNFVAEWLESRYKSIIFDAVQSIEPSIKEIDFRVDRQYADKKRQLVLSLDDDLYDLMYQVYEKDTVNGKGCTFEKYFTKVVQSFCKERIGKLANPE